MGGFHGTLTINDGIFGNAFNAVGDWTGSTADVVVNGSGVLDLRTDNITIDTLSGNGTVANTFQIDAFNTLTLGTGNGTAAFSGTIFGDGTGPNNSSFNAGVVSVIKTGTGVQYFDGNNGYSGLTDVQGGFLVISRELGLGTAAAGTTVQSGGTLQVENRFNGDVNIAAEDITINGFGVGGTRGALANWAGNNSWGGDVNVASNSSIFINDDSLNISGVVSGTSDLTKTGNGTLIYSGTDTNTLTGTTIISAGVTHFNKMGGAFAVSGDVQMGTGSGQPHLRMFQDNQFAPGVEMNFVNPDGQWTRFDLQGTTQTLAGLNAAAGIGAVVQNERLGGGGTASDGTLIINGSGINSFHGHMRDEDDGGSTFVLNLQKDGSGTQTIISSDVTYSGTTTVNDGILELQTTGGTFRRSNGQ